MRNAALLMASLLLGSMALTGGKRATAQGPSEQFAAAEAMRRVKLWPNRTRATGAPSANAPTPAAMAGNETD